MPRAYTASAKTKFIATSGEAPVTLLEITHADLAQPVRVCDDNQNIVSNGNTFIALAFRCSLPDDFDSNPRARVSLDNVGRELVSWLEVSGGGRGAKVRIMQVMRSVPNTIEWETTCDLRNVQVTNPEVSGDLGYEDLLSRPAVPLVFRPETAPGLF